MSKKYRVVVVGMGKRGMHHATGFPGQPALKSRGSVTSTTHGWMRQRPSSASPKGTDARELCAAVKPDVFCFCTLPNLRIPMIKAGIEGGAQLIAFEKPVALTSARGLRGPRPARREPVKAVVSHQHRYGEHYQKVKEIVASGALGRVHTVYGTATGWMTHMLSHLIDYTALVQRLRLPAEWVMAQAAGRGKLADIHPSPDYIAGFIQFANGVHGVLRVRRRCAGCSRSRLAWWRKCRIGAQGTDGFAEVLTGGGWRAVTKDGASSGAGQHELRPRHAALHPGNGRLARRRQQAALLQLRERLQGLRDHDGTLPLSRMGGQVALPLVGAMDEVELLKTHVADRPVLVSSPVNQKEYGVA